MSCSSQSNVRCPRCKTVMLLSLAAQLQSEQLGVACECPQCGHQWVYRIDSGSAEHVPPPVETEPHLSSQSNESAATHAEPTIFIVEDDDAVRDALDGLMRMQGWQTQLYVSAEEFQQHCQPTCPGCVLLDVQLPGISGLQLLAWMRESRWSIPVILMTESLDEQLFGESRNANAFAFFPKPFNIKALLESIRSALEQGTLQQPNRMRSNPADSGDRSTP